MSFLYNERNSPALLRQLSYQAFCTLSPFWSIMHQSLPAAPTQPPSPPPPPPRETVGHLHALSTLGKRHYQILYIIEVRHLPTTGHHQEFKRTWFLTLNPNIAKHGGNLQEKTKWLACLSSTKKTCRGFGWYISLFSCIFSLLIQPKLF